MYARLVNTVGTCFVYIWSDRSKNCDIAYKIHHTPVDGTSDVVSFPETCENDLYITFKCNADIDSVIKKAYESEFNNFKQYRLLDHCCAHGSLNTLKLAGIDLLPYAKRLIFNRIPLRLGEIRFPLFGRILTPSDLFSLAKDYELKRLITSNGEVRYRFTEFRVKLWIDSTTLMQERELVTKILHGIEISHKRYPERTEEQIELLNQTHELVTQFPNSKAQCSDYCIRSAGLFKQRTLTKENKRLNLLLNLYFFAVIGLIGGVGAQLNRFNKFGKSTILPSKQSLALFVITAAFVSTIGPRLMNLLSRYPQSKINRTELSDSMSELAHLRQRKSMGS